MTFLSVCYLYSNRVLWNPKTINCCLLEHSIVESTLYINGDPFLGRVQQLLAPPKNNPTLSTDSYC